MPLPADLELGSQIGSGRRSLVFAATWRDQAVVVKRYTSQAIRKYRRRYRVSIAHFEHDRNAAFHSQPQLRPFAARPLAWGIESAGGEFFIQEHIAGRELREFLDARGRLPDQILRTIDRVVDRASSHGLFDIDMSPSNFRMRDAGGDWNPVLFDFNLMPQHLHPPNPLVGLLYRTGLRHPAHRDRWMLRRLRTWPE